MQTPWVRRALNSLERRPQPTNTTVGYRQVLLDWALPTHLIRPVVKLMAALIVWDSVATWLWLTYNIATESNPVVSAAIDAVGTAPALGLRAGLSFGMTWLLAQIAYRQPSARFALFVAVAAHISLALYHWSVFGPSLVYLSTY